jgi:hypothetical protein
MIWALQGKRCEMRIVHSISSGKPWFNIRIKDRLKIQIFPKLQILTSYCSKVRHVISRLCYYSLPKWYYSSFLVISDLLMVLLPLSAETEMKDVVRVLTLWLLINRTRITVVASIELVRDVVPLSLHLLSTVINSKLFLSKFEVSSSRPVSLIFVIHPNLFKCSYIRNNYVCLVWRVFIFL